MKYKFLVNTICLLLAQPVFSAYAGPQDLNKPTQTNIEFSKIIFFGDSLSDNGNLYRDMLKYIPKDPPYYKGRFSNGRVWSEYVDDYFSKNDNIESINYAVGGQTAYFHNPFDGYLPYSLAMSRENYVLHSLFTDRSSTLFVIWVGANDYLLGMPDINQETNDVTNAIKSTVEDLIYHGGQNFLILNLPDISITPYGQASGYADTLKTAIVAHNIKLETVVNNLQESYKNINIHLYNINQLFTNAIQNQDEYNKKYRTHITNVTDPCWNGGYSLASTKVTEEYIAEKLREHIRSQSMNSFSNKSQMLNAHSDQVAHYIATTPSLLEAFIVSNHEQTGVSRCENPDEYLFWDRIHPGSIPHKIIGQELIAFIDANYK